jgi:hypothetical protein
MQGSLKKTHEAGGPDRNYRDHRGTLEDKNKQAYFCLSRVPVELLSEPSKSSHLISVVSVCSAKQNLCPKFLLSVNPARHRSRSGEAGGSVSLRFAFSFTESGYR